MKSRFFAASIMCLLFIAVASAQDYSIRANRGLNLRTAPSLNADIAGTVRTGDILLVVGHSGDWLKISRHSIEAWLADWVNYSRVEGSDETSSQTGTTADIDNCCFVDRECDSDSEWVDGYWAYQAGQCAAPGQSQTEVSSQPTNNASAETDNCCFAGWHCQSNQEWVNGYMAYQNNQCNAPPGSQTPMTSANSCCQLGWKCTIPSDWILGESVYALFDGECIVQETSTVDGVIIEGSDSFLVRMKESLDLLKRWAPEWHAYVIKAPYKIRQSYWSGVSNTLERSINVQAFEVFANTIRRAHVLVHEACHLQRWLAGLHRYETDLQQRTEEALCELVVEHMLDSVRPGRPHNDNLQTEVNRLISEGVDVHELANTERHRAYHLLSTLS